MQYYDFSKGKSVAAGRGKDGNGSGNTRTAFIIEESI